MAALEGVLDEDFVRCFLTQQKHTYEDLVVEINNPYPNLKGCSLRSVKRFCSHHGIRKRMPVCDEALDTAVRTAVSEVGPTFGRKMMKGYLDMQAQRTFASEGRIRKSLSRVAPLYHHQRQRGAERQINPQPYTAEYHGHKLHMDQNEKLVNYGVVHVCAVDGFSRFIPSFACITMKNNILIYEHVYRKAVIDDCLPDQVRVDHGREFYLTLFGQESLAFLRTNTQRDPHRQTQSKKNLRIERFWVEVNARVNHPIKNALRDMEQRGVIDMELEFTKFYVSSVTLRVARVGMQRTVNAWNHHPIPGVVTPVQLRSVNFQGQRILPSQVPTAMEAVAAYENLGGTLTVFPTFGVDPLAHHSELQAAREQRFNHETNDETLFGDLVNGNSASFEQAIQRYANITIQLVP